MLQRWFPFDDVVSEFLGFTRDIPCDVREDDKGFEIEVDLPGVNPADIDIGVSGGKLSLKANRKWAKTGERATFHRSFSETFVLPQTVDFEGILATYSHGVLRVTVPKRAGPAIKKIEVKTV